MTLAKHLTPDQIARINAKIEAVERLSSAEIRVILTGPSWFGIRNKAIRLFRKHGLDRTEQRNCALILIDVRNRELVVYGDEGIDSRASRGTAGLATCATSRS